MESENVRRYFEKPEVVDEYMVAAVRVGLWESEKIVIERFIGDKNAKILELGCGAGRISHALSRIGYSDITATDFSSAMVESSLVVGEQLRSSAKCLQLDATKISKTYSEGTFDAVIFGFNGLMQIPKRENRIAALSEIFRVLKPGGIFIFTTHDRAVKRNAEYWNHEKSLWQKGKQKRDLDEFGDILYEWNGGKLFIHSPLSSEIEQDLNAVGFSLVFTSRRSDIAIEPQAVLDFSDDCVFRTAVKSTSA